MHTTAKIATTAAVLPAAAAAACAAESDAELLRLGAALERAIERLCEVSHAHGRAEELYMATRPAKPEPLSSIPALYDGDGNPLKEVIVQMNRAERRRWELYREADERAKQEARVEAAEEEMVRKCGVADRIAYRIMATSATTAAGLRVKLKAARLLGEYDVTAMLIVDSIEGDVAAMG